MIERFGMRFYEPSDIDLLKSRLEKYPVARFEAITAYFSQDHDEYLFSINIEGERQQWFLEAELITYLANNGLWLDTSGYNQESLESALRAEARKRGI